MIRIDERPRRGDPSLRAPRRLEHLDALRGIAALTVVACHFVSAFGLPGAVWWQTMTPLGVWWDGDAAVSFFFVLSGLVLAYRHFRSSPSPNLDGFHFAGYATARVCRIWLPYLAILFLSVPLGRYSAQGLPTVPAGTAWLAGRWAEEPTAGNLLRQAVDVRVASPGDGRHDRVPQAWSLTVEIVFSLLMPLGIVAAGRSTRWFLGSALLLATLTRVSPFIVHFAIGIALAKHYREIVGWLEFRSGARAILAVVGLPLYSLGRPLRSVPVLSALDLHLHAQALGAACLIAVASSSTMARTWLSRGFIHHVGRISFSLYLSHILVLFCLTPRLMAAMGTSSPMLTWLVGLLGTIGVSLAISDPMYRLVEAPTTTLGRFLGRRLGSSTRPTSGNQESIEPPSRHLNRGLSSGFSEHLQGAPRPQGRHCPG